VKEAHLEQVRAKLGAAGLEELAGGDTNVSAPASPKPAHAQPPRHGGPQHRGGPQQRGGPQRQQGRRDPAPSNAQPLPGKPYGFVALPGKLTTSAPVWHDGTGAEGRLSGEIRFELKTLTPLLVGWEHRQAGDNDEPWPVTNIDDVGAIAKGKSVLCPLRAPWGKRLVVLPGDSLKGLLRHELGALLGAPMERVAERSYSYRPNSMFAKGAQLIPRLARVPQDGVETRPLASSGTHQVRVPTRLELLADNLEFDSPSLRNRPTSNCYRFDDGNGAPYRGGQGAGAKLNSKPKLHTKLTANPSTTTDTVNIPASVQEGYLATLRHLTDLTHGHFGERHPDVPKTVTGDAVLKRILDAAANVVFQPGDLIWVEWDTDKKCIVSLGWHYYYRWAYTDSVRRRGGGYERHGLFPLAEERARDADGTPRSLSPVRRLFGYTGDNEGSAGIGEGDHAQLMGRISVNAGLEVVADGDTDDQRFLSPTFLKELGMPRPSAVEHYVQQPQPRRERPSDKATLVTYGDAAGYDTPGELAGRKFYLDRAEAYETDETKRKKLWADDSPANRANERSTLALEASQPGRRFRFTVRFRDLDPTELAAIVTALCPHQLRDVLGGKHGDGYCSKLGYARPLGWGTVRIEARSLLLLAAAIDAPALNAVQDVVEWVRANHQPTAAQAEWLAVHRHKHPHAADYPTKDGQIYTFHTSLRAEHTRARRYRRERSP
jgi:CRISPR-associated protein (TIGR03986 family)